MALVARRKQDPRRRRLLGAAGGAGVLLSVQAKTALGQTMCESMSGTMSGNASPHSDNPLACVAGRSPGFWKQPQHFNEWPNAGATPPTFGSPAGGAGALSGTEADVSADLTEAAATEPVALASLDPDASTMAAGGQKPKPGPGRLGPMISPGTLVLDVLPGAPIAPEIGIWEVLHDPVKFGSNGQLMRHLIAAWMNAAAIPNYVLSQAQVQNIWVQLRDTGSYCPPGITCSMPLGPEEVKQYIESTYN